MDLGYRGLRAVTAMTPPRTVPAAPGGPLLQDRRGAALKPAAQDHDSPWYMRAVATVTP